MCRDAFGGQEKIPGYDVASGIFGEPPKRDTEIYSVRQELIRITKNDYELVIINMSHSKSDTMCKA